MIQQTSMVPDTCVVHRHEAHYKPAICYNGNDDWELLEKDLIVVSGGRVLIIPVGTHSDLSSVPRVLWPIMSPFESSIAAPFVHDQGYRHGGLIPGADDHGQPIMHRFTREEVDNLFLDIMKQDDVVWWRRTMAYQGVRKFGAAAWQA